MQNIVLLIHPEKVNIVALIVENKDFFLIPFFDFNLLLLVVCFFISFKLWQYCDLSKVNKNKDAFATK